MEEIPFRRLLHQSTLFLDYVELAPEVLAFYHRPPTFESVRDAVRRIPDTTFPRERIASIMRRQNAQLSDDASVTHAIEILSHQDSVAVVTGQQVGMFSGPLYTIYKALTAIRIAADLRASGTPAVAIFWMDSEDHDLAEVTRRTVIQAEDSSRVIDFRPLLFADIDTAHPVGSLRLPEAVRQAVDEYIVALPGSEWKSEMRAQLESAYTPGATLSRAFGHMMADLLRGRGLILFDPQDPEAKHIAAPLFEQVIRDADQVYLTITERNRALQTAGYHTQVNVLENSTALFFHEGGERRAIVRDDGGFALKNSSTRFGQQELLAMIRQSPDRFSPNVLLRPIVQDHLFPTVAYVGGPAEVAYFAQISALYSLLDRTAPAIWPRATFTLLDAQTSSIRRAYDLNLEDCLEGKQHIVGKMIRISDGLQETTVVRSLHERLQSELEELRPGLVTTDPTLGQALDTAKRKILHNLEHLLSRFVHQQAMRNTTLQQAEFFLSSCYPNKNLQERELGIHYFLAQRGPSLIDDLYSALQPEHFVHRILEIS